MIQSGEILRVFQQIKSAGKVLYELDLEGYYPVYLERRLNYIAMRQGLKSGSMLLDYLVNQPTIVNEINHELNIGYTSFFRDPAFYLRTIGLLKRMSEQQSSIRIWHAGCSKGHEVYSLLMLLSENKLLERCRIYATDINYQHLQEAKRGIVRTEEIKSAIGNYLAAGGKNHINSYFNVIGSEALLKNTLLSKICFGHHDLGNDDPFQHFDFIICRNVLIYYQAFYQKKIIKCLYESLTPNGYLGLSPSENIDTHCHDLELKCYDQHSRIYRRTMATDVMVPGKKIKNI